MEKKFQCDHCDYVAKCKQNYETHLLSKRHYNKVNKIEKTVNRYACELCKFETIHRVNFVVHQQTNKHLNAVIKRDYYNLIM